MPKRLLAPLLLLASPAALAATSLFLVPPEPLPDVSPPTVAVIRDYAVDVDVVALAKASIGAFPDVIEIALPGDGVRSFRMKMFSPRAGFELADNALVLSPGAVAGDLSYDWHALPRVAKSPCRSSTDA